MFSTVPQICTIYLAEKRGNAQDFISAFEHQRRYMDAYFRGIEFASAEDNFEGMTELCTIPTSVGVELEHLYPFGDRLLQGLELAGITAVEDFEEAWDRQPFLATLHKGGMTRSTDGSVRRILTPIAVPTLTTQWSLFSCAAPHLPYEVLRCPRFQHQALSGVR